MRDGEETCIPWGPHGLSLPWVCVALAQDSSDTGATWIGLLREQYEGSHIQQPCKRWGCTAPVPQVQSIVRLRCFPSHMQTCAKHTHKHSHCKQHASAQTAVLSAHTHTNSPDGLMVLTSLANQLGGPPVIIIYISKYMHMYRVDPSSSWVQIPHPRVHLCFPLDTRVASTGAPPQMLAQVTARTHVCTPWCTCAHTPSRDVTVAHTHTHPAPRAPHPLSGYSDLISTSEHTLTHVVLPSFCAADTQLLPPTAVTGF